MSSSKMCKPYTFGIIHAQRKHEHRAQLSITWANRLAIKRAGGISREKALTYPLYPWSRIHIRKYHPDQAWPERLQGMCEDLSSDPLYFQEK